MFREILKLWQAQSPLKVCYDEAAEMLSTSKLLYEQATEFVLSGKAPEFDLHARDKDLNRLHQDICRRLLEHLTINPKQDVVAGLVLLSIVNDIERLGDYCKNIEELPELAGLDQPADRTSEAMREATDRVGRLFDEAHLAFTEADKETAQRAMASHRDIRKLCDAAIEQMFQDETVGRRRAIFIVLYMRFLKRISAHLKNVCTSVVNPFDKIGYTKTGLEVKE